MGASGKIAEGKVEQNALKIIVIFSLKSLSNLGKQMLLSVS